MLCAFSAHSGIVILVSGQSLRERVSEMEHTYQLDQKGGRLSRAELLLLLLPVAASAFVGLFQLLLPGVLARLSGYSGDDVIVYWLSGGATFGYAGALSLALRQRQWSAIRLI